MQALTSALIFIFLVADVFFVGYAIGLNMKTVKVEDGSLAPPAVQSAAITTPTVSTTPPASTTTKSDKEFTDLKSTDERLQANLMKAADAGILDPTKDKQFRPNEPVTRADFARWMVRTRQVPEVRPDTPTYSDVDAANPYYGEIEGATKENLVQGYNIKDKPQKQFKPDQNITRQELAVMYGTFSGKRGRAEKLAPKDIETYLKYDPGTTETSNMTYKDVGDVDDWARKWVAVAHQAGVLEQCFDVNPYASVQEKRYLHPQQNMTRAEAVNILVKLYGASSRSAVSDKPADAASKPADQPASNPPATNTTTSTTTTTASQ